MSECDAFLPALYLLHTARSQVCLFMARLEDPTSKMILSVLLTAGKRGDGLAQMPCCSDEFPLG